MNVAVVGSRKGVSPERVEKFVGQLWDRYGREMVLVSGGAEGVDKAAESAWIALGGEVCSYRIRKLKGGQEIPDEYGFEVWVLQSGEQRASFLWVPKNEPTWTTATAALYYRNLLIAEKADRGVAFWDGRSRGTSDAIDAFYAENKPIHVFREGASDGAQS